ncbi:uncharacterized protein FYW47_004609 [Aplochiton taeniatus]
MAAAKTTLRRRQKSALDKESGVMSSEASPDSKCPICLDRFNNMSYLDLCLHKFCFCCIHEWSKNKAECPLCKQPFNSIYHSIKSEKDFKKYDLPPLDNGSFGNFGGERFRYRTTLTGARRRAQRRTSSPPDNGVMFEAVTDPVSPRQDRCLRRMMMRLAAGQRAASEGRTVRTLREQEMIKFRRALYRRGVRVRSIRDGGRSRDTTAEFYQRNPACLHRLVPWLKRELTVLYGAHGSLVNIVQHVIMSRITRYDMEDGAIYEELRPFLQGRTRHFLHEFISFAKAPFNMEAYDQHAVYDCPAPLSGEDSSSNSSVIAISEDEEDSAELDPPGDSMSSGALSQSAWDDETPGPSYSTTGRLNRTMLLSVPDSESDSSLEEEAEVCGTPLPQRRPPVKTDSSRISGTVIKTMGVCDKLPRHVVKKRLTLSLPLQRFSGTVQSSKCASEDDDCVVVGFVKPVSERTPELVHLSSDSDESVQGETKKLPRLPQHIRFTSLSPLATENQDPDSGKAEGKEGERNRPASRERCSSSTSGRHRTSNQSSRRSRDCHARDGRMRNGDEGSRARQRSRSRERKRRPRSVDVNPSTRSPTISINSDSTLSRGKRHSRSNSRDRSNTKWRSLDVRREKDDYRSGRSHDVSSHSYHWQSYSRGKDYRGTVYTERRSYYTSSHRNAYSRSHSRSRSRSRESRHHDKRRSRSRSYSSTGSYHSNRTSRHDKPGGKRKYKTRHLEEPAKEAMPESHAEPSSSASLKAKKRSKEKRVPKSREKSGKSSRSVSVEIVYQQGSPEHTKKHHKKKKKHKKKSKRHKEKEHSGKRSPPVITIDSDSDQQSNDNANPLCGGNKDSLIRTTTGNPADSSLLESMLQEWEKTASPERVTHAKNVTKTESSPAVETSVSYQPAYPHMTTNVHIKIGIIGGSGLDDPDILEGRTERYVDTPYGKPSDALILGKIKNVECVLLARHGRQHTIMPTNVNYQANIWALREEGCTHVLVTTACGSLREEIQPGDIVIIDQFIDRTTKRAQTLFDGQPTSPPGVCHIPMADPFCAKTREVLVEVARTLGIKCHTRGTMITIEGPRFSSRAESLMYRQCGADVINMSTVPEVVLAKEAGLCYASIAMATDYDCWKEHEEVVCVDNVLKTMKENSNKASSLLLTVIPQICQMDWTATIKALKGAGREDCLRGPGFTSPTVGSHSTRSPTSRLRDGVASSGAQPCQ